MAIPFTIAELDHVVLRCRNQARALDFYTRVLGLREERRVEHLGLIQLRAGAGMVDLIPAPDGAAELDRNVDHFCLGVVTDDLAKTASHLRALGVEVLGEPEIRYGARGLGRSIYIRDPEGNVIELKQMPAGLNPR
ncbi:MAG TPA: VOC family protein [Candidatus Binataceae bacterium]|nr:VOC family protein [Candidatus Binataceae bacterium]